MSEDLINKPDHPDWRQETKYSGIKGSQYTNMDKVCSL